MPGPPFGRSITAPGHIVNDIYIFCLCIYEKRVRSLSGPPVLCHRAISFLIGRYTGMSYSSSVDSARVQSNTSIFEAELERKFQYLPAHNFIPNEISRSAPYFWVSQSSIPPASPQCHSTPGSPSTSTIIPNARFFFVRIANAADSISNRHRALIPTASFFASPEHYAYTAAPRQITPTPFTFVAFEMKVCWLWKPRATWAERIQHTRCDRSTRMYGRHEE